MAEVVAASKDAGGLRAAVEDVVGCLDGKKLGYKLWSFVRRNFEGLFLDRAGDTSDGVRWAASPVSEFARRRPESPPDWATRGGRQRSLTAASRRGTIDTMSDGETMSEVLRRAIRESGLALLRIAADTGVERASISRFVRGERSLRPDMADKLAAYFGLKLTTAGPDTTKRAKRG